MFHEESEIAKWISQHTKPCPNCHKPVNKNGGCNPVTCICDQSFCWLCGEATSKSHTWDGIVNHTCGSSKEKDEARGKHDVYLSYHNRRKAHTEYFKQESELKEIIEQKVALEEKENDFSWVTDGLDRLFRSTRAVLYTYPLAFYMFGEEWFKDEMTKKEREITQNLFEDQQQQLESYVDKLSKFLEEPFDAYSDEKFLNTRMQVINLSALIDVLCRKMYDCIENDLLGSFEAGIQAIALPKDIKREELYAADHSKEEGIKLGEASSYGASDDSQQPSRKRTRKESKDLSHIDLNLPAQEDLN